MPKYGFYHIAEEKIANFVKQSSLNIVDFSNYSQKKKSQISSFSPEKALLCLSIGRCKKSTNFGSHSPPPP